MLNVKKVSVATLGAALLSLSVGGVAQAVTVVAPSSNTNAEGNDLSFDPFSRPSRLQQVYAASEFSSLSGPLVISQIAFRPDSTQLPTTLPPLDLQISFSTTTRGPDGLSPFFAQNTGANNTVVYNGSFTPSTASTGSILGPKAFDINIPLQTAFTYNPASGNLLVDIRDLTGGLSRFLALDAQTTLGDSVSMVVNGTDPNGIAGAPITKGLVTQFTINAAPVPFEFSPTLGLVVVGAWGAFSHIKSKVQKSKISGSSFSNNQ